MVSQRRRSSCGLLRMLFPFLLSLRSALLVAGLLRDLICLARVLTEQGAMSTDPIAGPSTISASTSSSNSAFPYTDATLDPETVLALNRQVAKPFWVEKTKREAGKAWNLFYKQSPYCPLAAFEGK